MRLCPVLVAMLLMASPVAAQTTLPTAPPFLILDQDRLFSASNYGQSLRALNEVEAQELREQNEALDLQFEEEERQLTELRATLAPEAFREQADAFDEKVIAARREQEVKAQALANRAETRRREFFRNAGPVLLRLLEESGASAVIESRSVLLSKQDLNITDEAIKRLDAAISEREAQGIGPSEPQEPTGEDE